MKKILIPFITILVSGTATLAQDPATQAAASNAPGLFNDPVNWLLIFVIIILLSTILVMARVIKLLTWSLAGSPPPKKEAESAESKVSTTKKGPGFWSKLNQKLSDSVPVEKEADVLLDHDYDGIRELDNNLPPWWKVGFYLTIAFAFIYMAHYHLAGSGNVQLDEYNNQLAEAELQKKERLKLAASNVDETNATILTAEADIASGRKIYTDKCLVCHGQAGEGLVGPNLTDDYWIHGGSINDVFKIIKYGFPSKGMLAWQGQLTPVQIQQVASFVKSIKGTNPPNAKAPQGDLYTEGATSTGTDSTARQDTTITIMTDSIVTASR